ncbi:MAG: phosphoribosylformylglycinamidine cyclo-ligase [Candidatus Latescibacterota bacterium]|nr:phosphoribosylformylglycinamidine cyclo-ligase [Candidatus Latescibacterota bacterium]
MTQTPATGATYADSGVDTDAALSGLDRLLKWVARARHGDGTGVGASALEPEFFASVVDLGGGQGLALSTDGVGTKVLVAQMVDKYDTIGIDCVAMNVNDLICVGAEPLAMLDYLGVERVDADIFEEIGKGLHAGAELANISIPGGEISQMREVIRGVSDGTGLDIVGTAVGLVDLQRLVVGDGIEDGDVVVGLQSNGIHSNGLTLARRVLFKEMNLAPNSNVAEFGHSAAEELLRPTAIYVRPAMDMLREGIPVKAFSHITSDGFLNLLRVRSQMGYHLHTLPETPAIFQVIQQGGGLADEEMFLVFNMGIGFGVVVAQEHATVVQAVSRRHGFDSWILGTADSTQPGRVFVEPVGLMGEDDRFRRL